MEAIVICLAIVVVIAMVILSIILYNFMLLTSEINKRMVYIVADAMEGLGLSTPHMNTLYQEETEDEDDILDEEIEEPFNPHNFDPLTINEED